MNHISWVLTVPAIWDDDAKIFMRRVAFQVCIYANKALYGATAASIYPH